jgi:hypothetical protein
MNTPLKKIALLLVMALLLAGAGRVQTRLNVDRGQLGLTRTTPLENAPPALAFSTVALGGFRGLIANALWLRMNELQSEERFFEMVQLAEWITTLQPHYAQIWRHQAWNMAYNISVKLKEPSDRWFWVSRGIDLLRNRAIPLNPHDADLYQELAWLIRNKIGYIMDDSHYYYKQKWAEEMVKLFGKGQVNLQDLVNPQTDEARARAQLMREKYHMDPEKVVEIDQRYGPLEWRLPDAHAIYWAELGLKEAKQGSRYHLRMAIYQSMQMSVLRGRFVYLPGTKELEVRPNLDLITKANTAYEAMLAESANTEHRIDIGHKNFLKDAVYQLYVYNRLKEAEFWYQHLLKNYPEPEMLGRSYEEFAIGRVQEWAGRYSLDRINGIIEGLIENSFLQLALGEDDHAAGLQRLAAAIWKRHQEKFADQQERMGLKPISAYKQQAAERLLGPESRLMPELQARLRTELNLPAPTNSVPPLMLQPQPK